MSKKKSYYYDVRDDIAKYPDAVFIITYGGRGTGKTYSALRTVIEDNTKFVFIKRTLEDVKLLTAGNKIGKTKDAGTIDFDASPFKPLNRDFEWNIRAFSAYPGLGGFFSCDKNNNPVGDPKGYIAALSGIGKIKGYDLSDCDVMIYDEFCPKSYEVVSKHEETEILDMYKTVMRDREHRGRAPLKLWAFANSDNVVCPLTQAFDLLNVLAEMAINDQEYYYDPEKRLLLHKLKTAEEFIEKEAQSPIYKAAAGSKWAKMALSNDFAFNDFSQVGKMPLKNMICEAKVLYNNKTHFVYYSPETAARYITYTNHNKQPMLQFDLNKLTHKKQFVSFAELKVMGFMYGGIEPSFEKYDLFDLYTTARRKLI